MPPWAPAIACCSVAEGLEPQSRVFISHNAGVVGSSPTRAITLLLSEGALSTLVDDALSFWRTLYQALYHRDLSSSAVSSHPVLSRRVPALQLLGSDLYPCYSPVRPCAHRSSPMPLMRTRSRRSLVLGLFLGVAFSSSAAAQYREQAAVTVSRAPHGLSRTLRASFTGVPPASAHRRVWPWLALGGGVLGGGTVWALVTSHRDRGCRDDGGRELGARWAVGAAAVGAVVGTLIGSAVDDSRGRSP